MEVNLRLSSVFDGNFMMDVSSVDNRIEELDAFSDVTRSSSVEAPDTMGNEILYGSCSRGSFHTSEAGPVAEGSEYNAAMQCFPRPHL
jgi:hypothetical protein